MDNFKLGKLQSCFDTVSHWRLEFGFFYFISRNIRVPLYLGSIRLLLTSFSTLRPWHSWLLNFSQVSDAMMHWCCKSIFSNSLVILFGLRFWDYYHHTWFIFLCHIQSLWSRAVSTTNSFSRVTQHIALVSGFKLLSRLLFLDQNWCFLFCHPKIVSWAMPLDSGFFTSLNGWSFRVNKQLSFSVGVPGNLLNCPEQGDSFKILTALLPSTKPNKKLQT